MDLGLWSRHLTEWLDGPPFLPSTCIYGLLVLHSDSTVPTARTDSTDDIPGDGSLETPSTSIITLANKRVSRPFPDCAKGGCVLSSYIVLYLTVLQPDCE